MVECPEFARGFSIGFGQCKAITGAAVEWNLGGEEGESPVSHADKCREGPTKKVAALPEVHRCLEDVGSRYYQWGN